jgi:antitoxin component YwqK of YwqJK toxin-antitoxin module
MKNVRFLLVLLFLISSCTKSVDESTLIEKDGLMYTSDSEKPYTGEVFDLYDTGENFFTGVFEEGKLVGDYVYYRKDGQIQNPQNYKDIVEKEGLTYSPDSDEPFSGEVIGYYSNGEVEFSGIYMFGSQVQKYSIFDINGHVKQPVNINTLVKVGDIYRTKDTNKPYSGYCFSLYPNSQTMMSWNLIDGTFHGEVIGYYHTGEIEFSGNFMFGSLVQDYSFYEIDGTFKKPVNTGSGYDIGDDQLFRRWRTYRPVSGPYYRTFSNYHPKDNDSYFDKVMEKGLYVMGKLDGEINFYYYYLREDSTGNKKETINYSYGVVDGPSKSWYENGQLQTSKNYVTGTPEGKFYRWYETGEKMMEGEYTNKGTVRSVTHLYKSGQKKSESYEIESRWGERSDIQSYGNGHRRPEQYKWYKNGISTRWYENGQKMREGEYKDNEKVGEWKEWNEDGQKHQEGTFKHGEQDGLWTMWYENGQKSGEGTFKDGKKTGLWTEWSETGQKSGEGKYHYGVRDSIWNDWVGEKRDKTQTDYRGDEEGRVTGFFVSGEKFMEGFKYWGEQDGQYTFWYKNGNKLSDGYRKGNNRVGHYTRWYENGQKMREGEYRINEKVGEWKEWNEDGTPK